MALSSTLLATCWCKCLDLDLAVGVDKVRSSVWKELVFRIFPYLNVYVCMHVCVLAAIRMGQLQQYAILGFGQV